MSDEYPEFQLRLPHGGPMAHGRLLHEMGTNGSQKFQILAGSPVRPEVVPSFPKHMKSSHLFREGLIAEGAITRSTSRPEYLETARDIVCNSPSAAAEILLGRAANGWTDWRTEDGRPLADFLEAVWWGPNRAWLVRGADIAGFDLVQRLWLPDGLVSLAAERLRQGVEQGISKERLRGYVDEDYESAASYGQKQQLVGEFHAFLSRMKPGDIVCTISEGCLNVGAGVGNATQIASEGGRSNLRRPVEWQDTAYPTGDLPEELQQKLSIQHDLVDLTAVGALVAALGRSSEELVEEAEATDPGSDPGIELAAFVASRRLQLPDPTDALADDLLVHDAGWLREIRDLLWDERQVVFHPYFLVIDEMNRANLAKVFGELYFLLEYRNRSVRLTYSGDAFALPPNLFIIGTMNTADRSIALLDSAMRRRFAFVELSSRAEPTSGLLRRWSAREGHDSEPADLLEALNRRIADPDFRIGPSYLMKKGVYRDGGLDRTWRTKILPLLEEHHYGEGVDVEQRYGLAALRSATGSPAVTGGAGSP